MTANLFQESEQVHHRFQMMDEKSGRKLDRAIEVHTVELSKSGSDRSYVSGANRLAQWCWLILNAHECTAEELRGLFPDLEFQPVIGCLETISFKTEDKAMHDQREKAQRDYDWMLSTARKQGLEEGIERGIEQGFERGIERGIEQGIEQGREEGTIHGAIQALQQILGDVVSSSHELSGRSDVELKTQLAELQERVRSRLK
ncbi:MAG: PD-(D/E)XK nuclease family transposase [Planctomyces sp.]|nr:PD-(D/E)XK nuclease family transposase [Planctomyces sp.]